MALKISDLIEALRDLEKTHGDLPCYTVGEFETATESVSFEKSGGGAKWDASDPDFPDRIVIL